MNDTDVANNLNKKKAYMLNLRFTLTTLEQK